MMETMTNERRMLVEDHIAIARSEARRFRLEDAESESLLILVEAAATWDKSNGTPFGAWLRYLIRTRLPSRVASRKLVRVPHQAYARARYALHPDHDAMALVRRAHAISLCGPASAIAVGLREHTQSAEDVYVEEDQQRSAHTEELSMVHMIASDDDVLARFLLLRFDAREGVVSLRTLSARLGLSITEVMDLERRLLQTAQRVPARQSWS